MLRPSVVAFCACLATAALCPGQAQPAEPAADPGRAEKAIADYEALKSDRNRRAQRTKALEWLGAIDDPKVTDYLRRELDAAGEKDAAVPVLEAIGRAPRPALLDDVVRLLQAPKVSAALRTAAAQAAVKSGPRGIERLVTLVQSDSTKDDVRGPVVGVLIASRDERALRGVLPLFQGGTSKDRLALLRRFGGVHGFAFLDQMRLRLLGDGPLDVAACAWRQLAEGEHPRAKALAVDVLERVTDLPPAPVAADLVTTLVLVGDPDFFPVLLRFAAMPQDPVRQALRALAPRVAKDAALVRFLATEGLEHEDARCVQAAVTMLREAPAEAVQPLVAKVRAALKDPKKRSLDFVVGMHDLLAKDPTWRQDLMGLVDSGDPESRTVGLSLLRELGDDSALVAAQKSLDGKTWGLRAAALRYLTRFRAVATIPLLIARLGKEEGRLAWELDQALFVHTGTRCFSRKEWEAWWQQNRTGFVLPAEATVSGKGAGTGGGRTASYYDIPLVSNRIAFLVDISGSMLEKLGTDKKRTRLTVAKEQLVKVVQELPETHFVNFIAYATNVFPLWRELRPAEKENREEVLARVEGLRADGGTNIFDALETAYRDPEVDTIYLLTDGQPTAGRLVALDDIREEVQRWNRSRQVVIHCISLGLDSELLKVLAKDSGGVYQHVK